MRHMYVLLLILGFSCNLKEKKSTVSYMASDELTLASPILRCEHIFFTDSVSVTMDFSLPDSKIRYTVNDTLSDPQAETYAKALVLKETSTVYAKAFHPEYKSSATIAIDVVKTNDKLKGSTIKIAPEANSRYQGQGALSLIDHKKGATTFSNGNEWLGFQSNTIEFEVALPKKTMLSKVTLSTLTNHGAWIFSPKKVAIFSKNVEIGSVQIPVPDKQEKNKLVFTEIPIKNDSYTNLNIVVTPLETIPDWHQGKGTLPWFFVDEILVE